METSRRDPGTIAIHGGVERDPVTGEISPPIALSVTYGAPYGAIGFSAEGTDEDAVPFAYQREGHPNAAQLERRLALLDNGEDAVVFASGIAAISGLLFHLLKPGDHLLLSDVSYAGTAEFCREILTGLGIEITLVDMSDLDDLRAGIRPNSKVIYAETPCNPTLKIVDIEAISSIARNAETTFVVDGTFATPAITKPLDLGADFVVYSLTKYMAGHGDAIGGAVVGDSKSMNDLRRVIGTHLGATLSPFNCWLIMRGLETLFVRMDAHSRSALAISRWLEAHPAVTRVRHPWLASHPQNELARRQMASGSGMIAFTVEDHRRFGEGLQQALEVFSYAPSLGSTRSLMLECNTADLQRTTFRLDDEHLARYREFAGEAFFRLSVGLESTRDLIADLERALSSLD